MRVLVGCEVTGTVRDAFRRRGHDAWSCDLEPSQGDSEYHVQADLLDVLYGLGTTFDLLIAHPPCQYLSISGQHWNRRREGRFEHVVEAVSFVERILAAPVERIAVENPVSILGTWLRKADQMIQPYEFGEDASKRTCLWLKNLPLLKGTRYVAPRLVNGRERWSNQTDSGQNRLSPSPERALLRATTYRGIAEAMADQWGAL